MQRNVGESAAICDSHIVESSNAPWLNTRAAPQRPRFHVLAVVEQGVGHHTVDFERYDLAEPRKPLALLALEHLRAEYVRGAGDPVPERIEVLRQLLTVFILRVLPESSFGAVRSDGAFIRFRQEVEQHFAASRQIS